MKTNFLVAIATATVFFCYTVPLKSMLGSRSLFQATRPTGSVATVLRRVAESRIRDIQGAQSHAYPKATTSVTPQIVRRSSNSSRLPSRAVTMRRLHARISIQAALSRRHISTSYLKGDLCHAEELTRANQWLSYRVTELINAIDHLDSDLVEYFLRDLTLEQLKKITVRAFRDNSLMHYAAHTGSFRILQLLINRGMPLNDLNADLLTPFMCAVNNNSYAAACCLIDEGADISFDGIDPYYKRQYSNIIYYLIHRDTDASRGLLHYLLFWGKSEIEKHNGLTPLDAALEWKKSPDMIALLYDLQKK